MDEAQLESARPMPRIAPLWRHYALLGIVAATVFATDQLTKLLVSHQFKNGSTLPLLGGVVQLEYARNTGAAFSLFQADGVVLAVVAIAVSVGILVYYRRTSGGPLLVRCALGLVLGGAMGNLVDRIRLGFVVDFIDLHWWPVFNVADSCIVVGVALLVLQSFLQEPREGQRG
jgi:signal peptidase II